MSLESLFHDRNGNAVGLLDGRLVIQARVGVLTAECIDAIAAYVTAHPLPDPHGALAVVNGDSGVMPEAIRARQQAFLSALLGNGAHMVTVVYGDTVHASTMRSVGRMMLLRQPRLQHLRDVPAAAAALAEKLSLSAARIEAAVETLQREALASCTS